MPRRADPVPVAPADERNGPVGVNSRPISRDKVAGTQRRRRTTMLAEIFLMQLQTLLRTAPQTSPTTIVRDARFIPIALPARQ